MNILRENLRHQTARTKLNLWDKINGTEQNLRRKIVRLEQIFKYETAGTEQL